MDFDDSEFRIFEDLLKKRPEINPDKLREDLHRYYLPYAGQLIDIKNRKSGTDGVIVGVSAIQGTGKTTQGEILEILLKHFGHSTDSRSIDDHYVTHKQLCELRESDPRFIRRGVTHDIPLAIRDLKNLQQMTDGHPILISGYYKGAHHGDGDRFRWVNPETGVVIKAVVMEQRMTVNKQLQMVRGLHLISVSLDNRDISLPENMGSDIPVYGHFLPDDLNGFLEQHKDKEITISMDSEEVVSFKDETEIKIPVKDLPVGWRIISKKPDFIFYDGWMLGASPVEDESVFDTGLDALSSEDDRSFARFINKKLADYNPLWELIEHFTVLYVPDYHLSIQWRDQAEETLRSKGEGMTHDEIRDFVYYFWRSVHPAIHIKKLAHDPVRTNQVVIINEDHTIKEVLAPVEVQNKYP